jgi:hypothetical protein
MSQHPGLVGGPAERKQFNCLEAPEFRTSVKNHDNGLFAFTTSSRLFGR